MGKGSGIRRLRRRIRHLPTWSKAAALALVGVVAFFGVAIGAGAAAERPEEPAVSLGAADAAPDIPVAVADEAVMPPDTATASAPAASDVEPTVLDAASGTADVNLFDASGAQRPVDPSEVPDVATALEAFRSAGCDAGFVVYDFASQRGLGCNADAAFSSASTIKAPFVTYVAQALVDEGRAALDDVVFEDTVMEGTGIMASDGQSTYDLATVLTDTIVYSDNTGYALLRNRYGEGFEAWTAAAGVVESVAGDYLVAVMSDADYDDAYFTDNEPLILNLIAALDEAHDRLLAA